MTKRIVLSVWLTIVWCFLWEDFSLGVILGGLLLSNVIFVFIQPAEANWIVLRPIPALRYFGFFLFSLVSSSIATAKVVLNPKAAATGRIIEVELGFTLPVLVTVVAHSISLTPGTLSVDARISGDVTKLYVHIMEDGDPSDERASIAKLERLVANAFGPKDVRRAVNERQGA